MAVIVIGAGVCIVKNLEKNQFAETGNPKQFKDGCCDILRRF